MNDYELFKAKRADNGDWIRGDLVHSKTTSRGVITEIYTLNARYEVDPATVCIHIGKHDGEGMDAFIGDVVADMNDPRAGLGVIEFNAESGILRINFDDEESVPIEYLPETLIIGNIHDEEYKKLIKKPDAAKPEKPVRPVPGLKIIKGGKK